MPTLGCYLVGSVWTSSTDLETIDNGWVSLQGCWVWYLKQKIDRRFIKSYDM